MTKTDVVVGLLAAIAIFQFVACYRLDRICSTLERIAKTLENKQ
jgi:hypothetical protein